MTRTLSILAALFVAATAAAAQQAPDPGVVNGWVKAFGEAGPWIAALLIAAGYLDLRNREERCRTTSAAIEAKATAAVDALNKRIDELQERRLADSERDAATLLAHAQAMGKVVDGVTAAIEKLTARIR